MTTPSPLRWWSTGSDSTVRNRQAYQNARSRVRQGYAAHRKASTGPAPDTALGQHSHTFDREVFVSPASSTSKPSELHEHVVRQLIERGRSQGYLEADDVRRAFEEADIPVSKASSILRSLSKEGVTVMVSAADSAAPKRARNSSKRATPATKKTKTTAATKEQDSVTAVVDDDTDAPATPARAKKSAAKPKKAAPTKKSAPQPVAKAVKEPEDGEEVSDADLEVTDLDEADLSDLGDDVESTDLESGDDETEGPAEPEAVTEAAPEEAPAPVAEKKGPTSEDESFVIGDDDEDAPAQQIAAAGA